MVKPNVTWSVQKLQATQTTTISRQQHPLPPGPHTAHGLSWSWSQLGPPQTRFKHFKTFLLLLPPAAAAQHRNADLAAPGQSPKSQPQHFAVHSQQSLLTLKCSCAPHSQILLSGVISALMTQIRSELPHTTGKASLHFFMFVLNQTIPTPPLSRDVERSGGRSAFPWQIGLQMLTLPTKHCIPRVRKDEPKLGQKQ